MVFDVYRKTSLKAEARSKRGKSTRRRVTAKNKTPNKWQGFIRDSSNLRLFHFLADELAKMITVNEVFVTKGKDVLTNSSHIDTDMDGLAPCTHEEADTRIFLHELQVAKAEYKSLLLEANDTDIIVIALSHMATFVSLGMTKGLAFGKEKRGAYQLDTNS